MTNEHGPGGRVTASAPCQVPAETEVPVPGTGHGDASVTSADGRGPAGPGLCSGAARDRPGVTEGQPEPGDTVRYRGRSGTRVWALVDKTEGDTLTVRSGYYGNRLVIAAEQVTEWQRGSKRFYQAHPGARFKS